MASRKYSAALYAAIATVILMFQRSAPAAWYFQLDGLQRNQGWAKLGVPESRVPDRDPFPSTSIRSSSSHFTTSRATALLFEDAWRVQATDGSCRPGRRSVNILPRPFFIDKVNRAANILNAVADGIVKGMQSFERRQQRRMQFTIRSRYSRNQLADKKLAVKEMT